MEEQLSKLSTYTTWETRSGTRWWSRLKCLLTEESGMERILDTPLRMISPDIERHTTILYVLDNISLILNRVNIPASVVYFIVFKARMQLSSLQRPQFRPMLQSRMTLS